MIKILNFIKSSKELLDFARSSTLATGYKSGGFNFENYSRNLQEMEKIMNKNAAEIILAEILVQATANYNKDGNLNIIQSVQMAIDNLERVNKDKAKQLLKSLVTEALVWE